MEASVRLPGKYRDATYDVHALRIVPRQRAKAIQARATRTSTPPAASAVSYNLKDLCTAADGQCAMPALKYAYVDSLPTVGLYDELDLL